jgi:hypothetical protein
VTSYSITPLGPLLDGSSPELLSELLLEFESVAREAGLPSDVLRPGLSAAEVEDRILALNIHPEPEVVVWFTWHDGSSDHGWPVPLFPFAPLRFVEERYTWGDVGSAEWEWPHGWLALGSTAHGMAVGPALNGHPRVRPISPEISLQGDSHPDQVLSLCTPVSWWIEAIRRGAYRWDGHYWKRTLTAIPSNHLNFGLA